MIGKLPRQHKDVCKHIAWCVDFIVNNQAYQSSTWQIGTV